MNEEEGKTVAMNPEEEKKPKAPAKEYSPEQVKRMRKEAAMELADYKKRLRESVELKELQVRELELNIKFYHVSKEHEKIEELIRQEEAKRKAEAQKVMEESKKSKIIVPDNKIITP